jgi:16S rRNA (uracil1498-N3)-methyltransferase
MRCFFYDGELKSGIYSTKLLPDSEKSHIFKVLRAKSGTEILLNNGKGSLARCRIISKNEFEIIQIKTFDKPDRKIDLFVAPPKKNSLDIILKQSVEAGVSSINLLKTERSVSVPEGEKYRQQLLLKLKEACKQAHNPFLPDVSISVKLNQLKDFSKNYDRMFFGSTENCSERYSAVKENKQRVADSSSNCKKFAWIVGPEGGFSEEEYRILKDTALPIQIGNWIMRVETACIAGIITVRNLYF